MNLRPYQEEAAQFLRDHDRAMILASVGAGKTAITLTAMRHARASRFLVLAPLRVAQHVWPAEREKWAPWLTMSVACGSPAKRLEAVRAKTDILVSNYENLPWLAEQDLGIDAVVFDELTRLKNVSGVRVKALHRLLGNVNIRWGLTGSFTSNGLEDVFGQCKVVDQLLLGRAKGAFMQQYFLPRMRGTHVDWEPLPGALDQVMARIQPATYLLESKEYRDTLPPLHTVTVPVEMDAETKTDYDTMRKNFVLELGSEQVIAQSAAVVTQKLQQLACGFVYSPSGTEWLSQHKIYALEDLLEENQYANTIVFYNYVAELEELQRRFPHVRGVEYIDDWNAGRVRLLALHPMSAGHGLNLQHGGHHIVWLSLPWSLELYEQAIGRLHRSGQTHAVWNYVLQTRQTIDERILTNLVDKRSLSDMALEALRC